MKFRLILAVLLLGSIQGFSQKSDTLYWYDATNKQDIKGIRKIVSTINDSTFKTTEYWKGQIAAIKYKGKKNGCSTPIKTDTLFSNKTNSIKTIIRNETIHLSTSTTCDSLLLIQHVKKYRKDQMVEELTVKRVGQFADCPCGRWMSYKNNKLMNIREYGSCYNNKLSNIRLIKTEWSQNKKYKLELYKEQMLFAMPGQGSDHMATIILKNKKGEILNYISSNSVEAIMYRDIEIEWDLERGSVWYGKARLFELNKKQHNK